MEKDIDSALTVNFHTSRAGGLDELGKKKRKIVGDRKQRIRARKSIKRFKEKFGSAEERTEVAEVETTPTNDNAIIKSKSPNTRKEHHEKGDEERKKSGEVISSLFRHNPEIPQFQKANVNSIHEQVFASDSFKDTSLHPYMVSNLEKLGYSTMTSVQQETIPKLVGGHDVLVKSQTGSGKTMAYAIPIIEDLCRYEPKLKRGDGTLAIILVPTRELAIQSYEVFLKLLKPFTWLVPGCIMGGEKRKAEKARLRKGVNILVATPGRMLDHIENTESLSLSSIKWLVLDEADRLLDLGFEEKVLNIVKAVDKQSQQRQTVLLSATLSDGVERLAGMSLKNPQRVAIGQNQSRELKDSGSKFMDKNLLNNQPEDRTQADSQSESTAYAIPDSLKQYFVITPCKLRLVSLLTLIFSKCQKGSHTKMIVFLSTQDSVEFHYKLVQYLALDKKSSSDPEDDDDEDDDEEEKKMTNKQKSNLDAFRLHGEMLQKDRTMAFHEFCSVKSGVLLCTDVAARGLHLPSVQWVVQYSCAAGAPSYVHRVGRTARAGTRGNTIMFLMPSELDFIQYLNQHKISIEEMKLGSILQDTIKLVPILPGADDTQRQLPRTTEETATYLQNCCENYVKNDKKMAELAHKAYQSYIRGYATYPHDLKSIFHVKHLHLGHVAKAFGLRTAPSDVAGVAGLNKKTLQGKRKHKHDDGNSRRFGPNKKKRMSEFSSPLVFSSGKKKKKKNKK